METEPRFKVSSERLEERGIKPALIKGNTSSKSSESFFNNNSSQRQKKKKKKKKEEEEEPESPPQSTRNLSLSYTENEIKFPF